MSNLNLRAYRPECFTIVNRGIGDKIPPLLKYQEGRKGVLAWLLRLTVNIFSLLPPEMFFTVNSFTSYG